MLKVTVDRSKWLHGEGPYVSRLLRPSDGKMCCLGPACLAMGFTEYQIRDKSAIGALMWLTPEQKEWVHHYPRFSRLYHYNDKVGLPDDEREAAIKAEGLKLDIEFTFVDGEPKVGL